MQLILSPHLDDAALSLGGLVAKEAANCVVATFFAGTPQEPFYTHWDTKCGFKDSSEAMAARVVEDKNALHALGLSDEHIYYFKYLDLEYRVAQKQWRIFDSRIVRALQKDIESLIAKLSPTRVYAPGLAVHPDHRLLLRAARRAARRSSIEFFLYQDMPYTLWVPRMHTSKEIPIPLSQEDFDKKLAGIACYTSQVPHLGKGLLVDIERYAHEQAQTASLAEPYCEVVTALK